MSRVCIEIEASDKPALGIINVDMTRIVVADEPLQHIAVASDASHGSRRRLQRHGDVAFAGHLRAVGDACLNVGFRQAGIVLQNFRSRGAACEQIEDEGNPNAMPADARLAEATLRIDPDALEKFFARHGEECSGITPRRKARPASPQFAASLRFSAGVLSQT